MPDRGHAKRNSHRDDLVWLSDELFDHPSDYRFSAAVRDAEGLSYFLERFRLLGGYSTAHRPIQRYDGRSPVRRASSPI